MRTKEVMKHTEALQAPVDKISTDAAAHQCFFWLCCFQCGCSHKNNTKKKKKRWEISGPECKQEGPFSISRCDSSSRSCSSVSNKPRGVCLVQKVATGLDRLATNNPIFMPQVFPPLRWENVNLARTVSKNIWGQSQPCLFLYRLFSLD